MRPPPSALRDPLPFDHQEHRRTFARVGLTCTDCHPVGARVEGEEPDVAPSLPSALLTCHACHLGEIEGAPKRATGICTECHADRRDLLPTSHDRTWEQTHGEQAMGRRSGCESCHDTATAAAMAWPPAHPGDTPVMLSLPLAGGGLCIACHPARSIDRWSLGKSGAFDPGGPCGHRAVAVIRVRLDDVLLA